MNKSDMILKAKRAHLENEVLIENSEHERAEHRQVKMAEHLSRIFELTSVRIDGERFRLGNIEITTDRYGDKLHLVTDCEHCKKTILSSAPISNLAQIGKALSGDMQWATHYCPESSQAQRTTPEQRVMDLLVELVEIVGPILPQ